MVRSTQGVSEAELIIYKTSRDKAENQETSGQNKGNFVKIYNTDKHILN